MQWTREVGQISPFVVNGHHNGICKEDLLRVVMAARMVSVFTVQLKVIVEELEPRGYPTASPQ